MAPRAAPRFFFAAGGHFEGCGLGCFGQRGHTPVLLRVLHVVELVTDIFLALKRILNQFLAKSWLLEPAFSQRA